MIMIQDATFDEILSFFDAVARHGRNVPTVIETGPEVAVDSVKHTVTYEATYLKRIFLDLREG